MDEKTILVLALTLKLTIRNQVLFKSISYCSITNRIHVFGFQSRALLNGSSLFTNEYSFVSSHITAADSVLGTGRQTLPGVTIPGGLPTDVAAEWGPYQPDICGHRRAGWKGQSKAPERFGVI